MNRRFAYGATALAMLLGAGILAAQAPQRAPRASLGVTLAPAAEGQPGGMTVQQVDENSPAAKGGLKPGDVIVKAGNREVRSFDDLAAEVSRRKPGDTLAVEVQRDGKKQDLTVTLGQRTPRSPRPGGPVAEEKPAAFLGIQMAPLNEQSRERFGLVAQQGVVVTEVVSSSPAAKSGLQAGDVITALNGKTIANPQELHDAIRQAGIEKDVDLQVLRGKDKKEFKAHLEEAPRDLRFSFPQGVPPQGAFSNMLPLIPDAQRVQKLEHRIDELEKRIRDLEQKVGPAKK